MRGRKREGRMVSGESRPHPDRGLTRNLSLPRSVLPAGPWHLVQIRMLPRLPPWRPSASLPCA